jgi:polyferredoxin
MHLQVECIGTAQCIGACDAVMLKLGRPTGLIRFTSERAQEGAGRHLWRPRNWLGKLAYVLVRRRNPSLIRSSALVVRIALHCEEGKRRRHFLINRARARWIALFRISARPSDGTVNVQRVCFSVYIVRQLP